jgi:hypothetical protein
VAIVIGTLIGKYTYKSCDFFLNFMDLQ